MPQSEQNRSHDNHLSAGALQRNTQRKLHMRGNREEVDVTLGAPHRTLPPHLAFFNGKECSCSSMLLVTKVHETLRFHWREILLRCLMRGTNTETQNNNAKRGDST